MAHCIENMAYVGVEPWHGLGQRLPAGQSLEVWQRAAGMDWRIESTDVQFKANQRGHLSTLNAFPEQKVLFRSDTQEALSVVSQRYQIVQPGEIMEFYRDLTETNQYELETAGVLKGGRKFWALARTGQSTTLKGNDVVNGYLLLATSCDGSMATTATPTSVRVVCQNTLNIAVNGNAQAVRVPHSTSFDSDAVKRQLGIAVSQWDGFMYKLRALAERKVKNHEAMNYFLKVVCDADDEEAIPNGLPNERALKKVQSLYDGQGRGADLLAAKGTAWGLVNAVTEYVDHEKRARSTGHRMDSAWFGQGANLKQRALERALQMVA